MLIRAWPRNLKTPETKQEEKTSVLLHITVTRTRSKRRRRRADFGLVESTNTASHLRRAITPDSSLEARNGFLQFAQNWELASSKPQTSKFCKPHQNPEDIDGQRTFKFQKPQATIHAFQSLDNVKPVTICYACGIRAEMRLLPQIAQVFYPDVSRSTRFSGTSGSVIFFDTGASSTAG